METITIQVDNDIAKAYRSLSPEVQSQINETFCLFLREYFSPKSLSEMMKEIGEQAQEHGFTPEILEALLKDE